MSTNGEKSLEYEVFGLLEVRSYLRSARVGQEVDTSRDTSLSLRSQIWNNLKFEILGQRWLLRRSHRLAAVVDALDGAGLVHPVRKLASMTVARGFRSGQIALAVLSNRDAKVVTEIFRVSGSFGNQAGAYKRRQI